MRGKSFDNFDAESSDELVYKYKGYNYGHEKIKEFQNLFGQPIAEKPTPMSLDRATMRAKWTVEEQVEFIFASARGDRDRAKQALDIMVKGMYKQLEKCTEKHLNGEMPLETDEDVIVGQVDSLGDTGYFNGGSYVEIGVPPQNIFDFIHEANMGKKWDDCMIHKDETGKVIKPPNWEEDYAPESKIRAEIRRLMQV